MKQGDTIAYGLNLLMLLFVALLPFMTRLMVAHMSGPDVSLATSIYGLNVLFASLTLSFLMFYVARQPQLVVDGLAEPPQENIPPALDRDRRGSLCSHPRTCGATRRRCPLSCRSGALSGSTAVWHTPGSTQYLTIGRSVCLPTNFFDEKTASTQARA